MKIIARIRPVVSAVLWIVLTSCAAFATPETFDQKLAYAYGSNTAIRQAATVALNRGTLKSEDGYYILEITDKSRTLLDAGKTAYDAGDPTTATGQLALALSVLDQLEAYLTAKGVQP